MAELKVDFTLKKTVWFYLVKLSATLNFVWLLKLLDGKPLANLYIGRKLRSTVNFNISEFL